MATSSEPRQQSRSDARPSRRPRLPEKGGKPSPQGDSGFPDPLLGGHVPAPWSIFSAGSRPERCIGAGNGELARAQADQRLSIGPSPRSSSSLPRQEWKHLGWGTGPENAPPFLRPRSRPGSSRVLVQWAWPPEKRPLFCGAGKPLDCWPVWLLDWGPGRAALQGNQNGCRGEGRTLQVAGGARTPTTPRRRPRLEPPRAPLGRGPSRLHPSPASCLAPPIPGRLRTLYPRPREARLPGVGQPGAKLGLLLGAGAEARGMGASSRSVGSRRRVSRATMEPLTRRPLNCGRISEAEVAEAAPNTLAPWCTPAQSRTLRHLGQRSLGQWPYS